MNLYWTEEARESFNKNIDYLLMLTGLIGKPPGIISRIRKISNSDSLDLAKKIH